MDRPRRRRVRTLLAFALLALSIAALCSYSVLQRRCCLSTAASIRALSRKELQKLPSVNVQGVVTYSAPGKGMLFVQDSTLGVRISVTPESPEYPAGTYVSVAGVATDGDVFPIIVNPVVTILEPKRDMPVPIPVRARDYGGRAIESNLVSVEGIVQKFQDVLDPDGKGLNVQLDQDGHKIDVHIAEYGGIVPTEIDRRVRIVGVAVTIPDVDWKPVRRELRSASLAALSYLEGERPPESAPLVTAKDLLERRSLTPARRVRLRGEVVVPQDDSGVQLRDQTGSIPLTLAYNVPLVPGKGREVAGFVVDGSTGVSLEQVIDLATVAETSEAPGEVLTSIRQVRSLTPAEAMKRYRVKLRATVTYYDAAALTLFLQDEEDGIYVAPHYARPPNMRVGDLLEVEGFSSPGGFAPIVVLERARVVGRAPYPETGRQSWDWTLGGAEDSKVVDVEGVVRSWRQRKHNIELKLAYAGHTFRVVTQGLKDPESLIDARIQVQGVCGADINNRRQILGVVLYVPGPEHLHVIEPAASPRSIGAGHLMEFAPKRAIAHRVKLTGIVTHSSGPVLFLRDGSTPVRARVDSIQVMTPGSVVEVLGYEGKDGLGPVLEDARVSVKGFDAPPGPARATAQDLVAGEHTGNLVQVDAYLRDRSSTTGEQILGLQSGATFFRAILRKSQGYGLEFERGSKLRLTGIVDLESHSAGRSSRDFRILVRSAADVQLLQAAPWWTTDRAVQVIGVTGLLVIVAFTWVGLLRRKVAQQTATIQTKLENEAALKQVAELASRAKSDFLAHMSHEIRTPMNGVLGYVHLALDQATSEEQREYLTTASDSAESLLHVLNDILDFSKIEAGKLTLESVSVNVRTLVTGSVRLLKQQAEAKGLSLTCEVAADVPEYVQSDPTRLRQVLLNLLSNAIKFTAQGWIVCRVSMEEMQQGCATLSFSVTDTGIGIAPDRQGSIFDSFSQADASITRRFGGTGLGLAISSRLVELLGGNLNLASEPGTGSTFWFRVALPVSQGVPAAPSCREDTSTLPALSVLIAEDNPVNQALVLRLLAKLNCRGVAVENGAEACKTFEQGAFDLILMDMQMPEMDGLEAARRIRLYEGTAHRGRIPIIALTANAMDSSRRECFEAGMDGYVKKPIRLDDLAAEIRRCVLDRASVDLLHLGGSIDAGAEVNLSEIIKQ